MLEELKVIIKAETDKFKKSVEDAERQTKSFKEQVADAGKKVEDNFKKAGDGIKKGIDIGVKALAGAGAALVALEVSTRDYRDEQAKLKTAFETAGSSADTAKSVYNDLYRVLGESDTSVEAANHLAKLTTNQEELSEWTNICQGVYATFGDSLPIEGLTEAANETAKVGQVTGPLADALNWAGISEDAFNESLAACATEQEREALIRETLNGLYDDASKKFEENNKALMEQREAQSQLNDAMAALGAAMTPIMTELTKLGAEVLTAITPHIQSFAENYLPVIKDILGEVTTKLGEALSFLLEHTTALGVIAAVIATVVTAIGLYNAIAAIKAAMDAAQVASIGALIAAYVAQAAAQMVALAPYVLIVAAIAAVIAIIVLCIKHWDDITKAVEKAWNFMKEKTKEAVDKIVEWFTNLKEKIQEKITAIKDKVVEIFTNIKDSMSEKIQAAKEKVVEIFTNIKDSIQEKIQAVKDKVSTTFENIKTAITNPVNSAKDTVNSVFNTIKSTVGSVASSILSTVTDKFNSIKTTISNTINGAKDTVKTAIDKIKGFFDFKWELPKLKLPHFKISGKFSLDPPSIPKFSVDWYARGGVFDNPTLFNYGGRIGGLGEAGAEAIVPLEKNTQWLDRIAERLSAGSGKQIILQVDGKTFAETSVDAINQLTKQRGSLPLVIA